MLCVGTRGQPKRAGSFLPRAPGILLSGATGPGVTGWTLEVDGTDPDARPLLWTASATDESLGGPGAAY